MAKSKWNLLYVDDEQQNLISFKATYRRDYNIYTANSGKEAIEVMAQNPIHLIITDQRMPEMTGVQFLEEILPIYPKTIRMILTGYSDVEAIIKAINKGNVFRYITKPWDERELKMTIDNAFQMYDLQINNEQLLKDLKFKVEEQERTLKLFMQYVPEEVVEKALSDSGDSIFEGEEREITVLFCDIRGFTSMSEEMEAKEVVSFLNDYYASMTAVIKKHHGVVNQFVGDEVFAVFGAPKMVMDGEEKAVFCALEMVAAIEKLSLKYQAKYGQKVEVGIGINRGSVVAGNLGSEDKIEYSVTGDTVNTGKRIETLTKNFPNTIFISENVYEKVKKVVEADELDPIHVKGKKEKLQLYHLIGKKEE